jgi:hypothetical protein
VSRRAGEGEFVFVFVFVFEGGPRGRGTRPLLVSIEPDL